MQSFDTVTLVGNLGGDPEIRSGDRGNYGRFSLFQTERRYDAETKGWKDGDTVIWPVNLSGNLADLAASHLHKGSAVMVYGQLQIKKWNDKNTNQPRERIEVRAIDIGMHLRGSGSGGRNQGAPAQGFGGQQTSPQAGGFPPGQSPAQEPWGQPAAAGDVWNTPGASNFNDETPF